MVYYRPIITCHLPTQKLRPCSTIKLRHVWRWWRCCWRLSGPHHHRTQESCLLLSLSTSSNSQSRLSLRSTTTFPTVASMKMLHMNMINCCLFSVRKILLLRCWHQSSGVWWTSAATTTIWWPSSRLKTPNCWWDCLSQFFKRTQIITNRWYHLWLVDINNTNLWLVDINSTNLWLVDINDSNIWLVDKNNTNLWLVTGL